MQDSFEEWIRGVFAHEVPPSGQAPWYFEAGAQPRPVLDARQALSFLTELCERPARLLESYTAEQIGLGCWYLTDPSCSDHMLAMSDATIAWHDRRRAIGAIVPLFDDLLRRCCSQDLGHMEIDGPRIGLANRFCYMFWDICPLSPTAAPDDRQDAACLDVLRTVLEIPHEACEESALHGLEEWAPAYPAAARDAVEKFLRRRDGSISPALRAYAERLLR